MLSRKQKRILRYVEEGNPLKLKSYLRKHSDLELSFTHGKRRRSLLHLACSHGDDATLRLLLKYGADILLKDRNGDTPMHIAANQVLKHGKRAYDDLVVPLRKSCPKAMEAVNNAGVTPQDLLCWMKEGQFPKQSTKAAPACQLDPEKEWQEKLFGECQDEFFETFGQYDADDFLEEEDDFDFGDWADRIRREYVAKQHAQAQGASRNRKKREKQEHEEVRRELQARLEREHQEYQARAAQKAEETKGGRKQRYEERCVATFQGGPAAAGSSLGYGDIPWPAPRGTLQEMLEVMLHGADRRDVPAFRKLLRRQQALWHPDKFSQRCGARLKETDRKEILDTVTALSQELNRLAQSLR